MIEFSTNKDKGTVIMEMDDTTACAVIQLIRMAIGDRIHEGFSDENKKAIKKYFTEVNNDPRVNRYPGNRFY